MFLRRGEDRRPTPGRLLCPRNTDILGPFLFPVQIVTLNSQAAGPGGQTLILLQHLILIDHGYLPLLLRLSVLVEVVEAQKGAAPIEHLNYLVDLRPASLLIELLPIRLLEKVDTAAELPKNLAVPREQG